MTEILEDIVKVDVPFTGNYNSTYDGKNITIPVSVIAFFKLRQRVSNVADLVIYYRGHAKDYPMHLEMTDNPPRDPMVSSEYRLMTSKRTRNRFSLPKELREKLRWEKGTGLVFDGRLNKFNVYTEQDYVGHVKRSMETMYRSKLVSNGDVAPPT